MLTLYTATVPAFIRTLEQLQKQLTKARAHAEATHPRDPHILLQDRLVFDQFPLVRQIQITCDIAKNQTAYLAGMEPPHYEDTEKTFEDVHARIEHTLAFLRSLSASQFQGRDNELIPFKYAPGKGLSAWDNALQYALPNFYFHAATAYAILRKNGVHVGKGDWLGTLPLVDLPQ